MNLTIALCDDDPAQIASLTTAVGAWAKNAGHSVSLSSFPSAEAFLFAYEENAAFDILLLDIEMGSMNGVALARRVRADSRTTQIIFITGYADYMAEGYEVQAVHYLIKPVSPSKIGEVLTRAAGNLHRGEKTILIETPAGVRKLAPNDILYAESFGHITEVHLSRETLPVKAAIAALAAELGSDFVRCHRSYLVSLRAVRSISKTDVILDSGDKVPLSRRAYQEVNRRFIAFYREETR